MVQNSKFIAIFTAFALTILACNLTGAGTGSPASADLPIDVLFQDNFSDPASGWDRVNEVEGVTDYTNGNYRILVNTDNTNIWANPGLNFQDTAIEVEATKIGGSNDNHMGLICRYLNESNFYFFAISSDGFYGIAKVSDGQQALIGMENMAYSDAINQGNNTNLIRAECIGQNLTLSVNGQQLLQVTDSQFDRGDAGLIAGTFDIAGTDIHFDNFIVRKP